jgi:hypothetical protein
MVIEGQVFRDLYKQIWHRYSLLKRVRDCPCISGVTVGPKSQRDKEYRVEGHTAPGGRLEAWVEVDIGLARYCLDELLR